MPRSLKDLDEQRGLRDARNTKTVENAERVDVSNEIV